MATRTLAAAAFVALALSPAADATGVRAATCGVSAPGACVKFPQCAFHPICDELPGGDDVARDQARA